MTLRAFLPNLLSPSLLRWMRRKRDAWQKRKRARRRKDLIKKHGMFTASELIGACRAAGVRNGGILFVQCSYRDLLTYGGTPDELLDALRELVGPQGTLLMPAYTTNMSARPCRPFVALSEPTWTGLLAEQFRRKKDVIRSLHPRHSICGVGPQATEILGGHENCMYADGVDSPIDKMRRMGAQSLCLGMRPGFTNAFLHWVEDTEPEKYPIKMHDGPFECILFREDGEEIRRMFYLRTTKQRNQFSLIARHLGPRAMHGFELKGVPICIYNWPVLAEELLALRDRGIVAFI